MCKIIFLVKTTAKYVKATYLKSWAQRNAVIRLLRLLHFSFIPDVFDFLAYILTRD